jgi:hypothetical protein
MFGFIKDPKTSQKSVSLTLLLISFIALLVGGGLEMFEVIKTVSVLENLFFTCAGLYFGRRINISKDNKDLAKE